MKKLWTLTAAMVLIAIVVMAPGCTQQIRAKQFGGSMSTKLPAGQKLVNVTWKNNDLWFLTRPMKPEDSAETYKFSEDSAFGLMEGTITIVETKVNN